jgi:hypothetical protein
MPLLRLHMIWTPPSLLNLPVRLFLDWGRPLDPPPPHLLTLSPLDKWILLSLFPYLHIRILMVAWKCLCLRWKYPCGLSINPLLHHLTPQNHPVLQGVGELPSPRYSRRDRKTTYKNIGEKNGMVFHSLLTIKQASHRYPNLVEQAVSKKLRQLCERGTFKPVHTPKGEKVVHSSVVMTPKFDKEGEL